MLASKAGTALLARDLDAFADQLARWLETEALKHTADNEGASESSLESRGQVDPLLYEGPAKTWRIWAVAIVIALIMVVVLYGLSTPTPELVGPRAVPQWPK